MMNKTSTTKAPQRAQWLNPPQPAVPLARYRLTLREGETYALSSSTREVCVLSGVACILGDGRQGTLIQGETRAFAARQSGLVISVSGDVPLVIEIALDAASDEAQRLKRQFYERMAARQQRIETEGRSERQC